MKNFDFDLNSNFVSEVIEHIARSNVIPIIGSGFTKGCRTTTGTVPDGDEMKSIMIREICSFNNEITQKDFESRELRFSQIAEYFYKFVPKKRQHEIIQGLFIGVKLPQPQKKFLQINWPYIYTLNIDDAIEKNSHFNKVLPYKKLSENVQLLNCVFKLHGDAFHEITYPEEQNIIFSREQYIKSLEQNKTMLSLFQSDYSNKNIIFIGCSLEDELDLSYIITTNKNIENPNILRIFVTQSYVDSIRKLELEHYGINIILNVADYNIFYTKISELVKSFSIDLTDNVDNFLNPKMKKLNKKGKDNKKFLQGFDIFNENGVYYLPDFTVKREITSQILNKIQEHTINLIIGRRVTGKTILMLQLAESIGDRNVYFFPSNISLSAIDINIVTNKKNSIILFDSNSLSYQESNIILTKIDQIKKNNSIIVFAINSSDRLMYSLLSSPEKIGYFELPDKLGEGDAIKINKQLSKLGLTNLKPNQSFIENFFRYKQIYNHDVINLPPVNKHNITDNDLKILILLASIGKIYSIIFNLLDIPYKEVEESLKKYEPAIQKEYPLLIELHQHSGFKAVSNCRSWIYFVLSQFTKSDKDVKRIASLIYAIVESIYHNPKFSYIYKNVILFDTLNQIFYKKEGGVIKLIFLIYEKLEEILYEDGHFWLQRAKSLLYLRRTDVTSLTRALDYAKKSHYDSYDDLKLKNHSTLTIAQILGRLLRLDNYHSEYLIQEAINWYYEALQPNRFNKRYIDNVISRARLEKKRNDLYSLVSFILKTKFHQVSLRKKAEWLVNKTIINK